MEFIVFVQADAWTLNYPAEHSARGMPGLLAYRFIADKKAKNMEKQMVA
jgi:hypothetical protein